MKKTVKTALKSLLAMTLALVMVVGAAPLNCLLTANAEAIDTKYEVGDIIEFGSYPQSEVTSESIISDLNAQIANYDWETDWISYRYYAGNADYIVDYQHGYGSMYAQDFMKYTDIVYNNIKYRAVKFTKYRPNKTVYIPSKEHSNQYDSGYEAGKVYWFIFEPLKWRVLDPYEGLVLCETIIDAQPFNNFIYQSMGFWADSSKTNMASDYETSSIRKWLNMFFYNTAFTYDEKELVLRTEIDNKSAFYSSYDRRKTIDKVFLLSYSEVQDNKYGFSATTDACEARVALASEYAICQGLSKNKNSNLGSPYKTSWALRTSFNNASICACFSDGSISSKDMLEGRGSEAIAGIRPALRLSKVASSIDLDSSFKRLWLENEVSFLDVNESISSTVYLGDVSIVDGQATTSNARVISNNDLSWYVNDEKIIKIDEDGTITALSEGLTYISASGYIGGEFLHATGYIYVGSPNRLKSTVTYDAKQYYADGGFYSEISSVSDCIEIYNLFENIVDEELKNIDDKLSEEDLQKNFSKISPIKLTATVSGSGLSFDRKSYQNRYTTTLNEIAVDSAVDDLLMLFPYNLNINSSGNKYTVKITLESDSFDPVTNEYTFTVENLENKSANEHIDFVSSNDDYKLTKDNIYGKTMVTLKDDKEYKWSKYSTFDFENYYEVVFADILIELMSVSQIGNISLVPVVKEWVDNYKTMLSGVTTLVEDSYTGYLDITENEIDKVLKKSKYTTDGMNVNDEIRDSIVLKLKDKANIDKVNSVFAKIDKTQQYYNFFELSVDITNDIIDFVGGVSVLNTYKNMDDNFKEVITNLYNRIPNTDSKLKDAVYHYVNSNSSLGYSKEILDEVGKLVSDISVDVFNKIYKEQFVSSLCKCIGNIPLKSGALLSSTTAFSAISTGLGAVSTGAQLGLCLSDILCDSSGKSEEMSKVVAMSEFSPYVIDTLNDFENRLYSSRNDNSVSTFEYAFGLHKSTQSYIMQHTINSLEIKRDSLIIKLFNRDDWDGLISDVLNQKAVVDNLKCHNENPESTVITETKVIAIKCPVDVYLYDEYGNEIVVIRNNIKELTATGIVVFVGDDEKYIAIPANQKYLIKIVATDSGKMDYIVTEYASGAEIIQKVEERNIVIAEDMSFTGEIEKGLETSPSDYKLTNHNPLLLSIYIESTPTTLTYTYKSDTSAEGLKVIAKYSDGSEIDVTDRVEVKNFEAKTKQQVGEKTATVEFEGMTADFTYTVKYAWWQHIIRILLLGFIWYDI